MSKKFTLLSFVAAFLMCLTVSTQVNAQQRVPGQFNIPWGSYLISQQAKELTLHGQDLSKGIPFMQGEGGNLRHMQRNLPSGANMATPSRNASRRAAITEPGEGEQAYYTRSGMACYYSNGYIYQTAQNGHVEIVEAEDGTIFIKDIISHFEVGTWVQGTKSGNTITISTNQEMDYYPEQNVTFTLNWVNRTYEDGYTNFTVSDESEITFTVEGDEIFLNNSSDSHFIGVCYVYQGNKYFDGEADWQTVWKLHEGYEPASKELVTPPADMTTETWYTETVSLWGEKTSKSAEIGFYDNEVYIKGIFDLFPDSWIKGTIDGSTVTFESMQYMGKDWDQDMWIVGALKDAEVMSPTYTMAYDAENQTITLDEEYNLFLNASEDNLHFSTAYASFKIMAQNPSELPVATGDPIDEIPYINTFDTPEDRNQFGFVDYNRDGNTWRQEYDCYSCANGYGQGIADDWLFSPAIKLEAGKSYSVSLDIWGIGSGFVETVEVKIGKEASAPAMTTTVLPPTETASSSPTNVEQESFFVSETGYYHFGIHSISYYGYILYIDNFKVSTGVEPLAPAAVTNLFVTPYEEVIGADISFTAPTTTANGTELTSNISVNVVVDDVVSKTYDNIVPGSANTLPFEDANLQPGYHTFYLSTSNEAGNGMKSNSVTVLLKKVLDVPYTIDFTNSDMLDLCQIIDANNDNNTWKWDYWYEATIYQDNYDRVTPGDDYLVTLPFNLVSGRYYNVVVNAYANYMTERFEVLVGKEATPEGLNITAIEPTVVQAESPMAAKDFEGLFMVPEDGKYYIAIHAISDADQASFCVKSLFIEKSLLPESPAAPELSVAALGQGALAANVSITAPTKSYNGEALGDNLSKIELYRDGTLITSLAKEQFDAAGTATYLDDQVPTHGVHTYQAIPYDKIGDPGMKSAQVEAFIGQDVPKYAMNFSLTDNENSIHFSWDPVTTGLNGEYINPEGISYNIWSVSILYGSYYVLDELLGSTNSTSFDLDYNTEDGNQRLQYWAVQSVNTAGNGGSNIGQLLVGESYNLPLEEHFINGQGLQHYWQYNDNIEFWIAEGSSDGDDNSVKMTSIDGSRPSEFATGKLNLKDTSYPVLVFDARTASANTKLDITGIINNREEKTIVENLPLSEDFATVAVPLESLKEGRYAQVDLKMLFPEPTSYYYQYPIGYVFNWGDSLVIDNLHIVDLPLPTNVTMQFSNGQVAVEWTAPATTESIDKYIIYVNGEYYDEVAAGTTSYTFDASEIVGGLTVAVSAYYSYKVETPAVEAVDLEPTAIQKMIAEGKPFDVYDAGGRLIRQQTTSLNSLKGLYLIKSEDRVASVVLP